MSLVFLKLNSNLYGLAPKQKCIQDNDGVYSIKDNKDLYKIYLINSQDMNLYIHHNSRFTDIYYDSFINEVFNTVKVVHGSHLDYCILSSINENRQLSLTLPIKKWMSCRDLLRQGMSFFPEEIVSSKITENIINPKSYDSKVIKKDNFDIQFHYNHAIACHLREENRLKELSEISNSEAIGFLKNLVHKITEEEEVNIDHHNLHDNVINVVKDLIVKIRCPEKYLSELKHRIHITCEVGNNIYEMTYHSYKFLIDLNNLSKLGKELAPDQEEDLSHLGTTVVLPSQKKPCTRFNIREMGLLKQEELLDIEEEYIAEQERMLYIEEEHLMEEIQGLRDVEGCILEDQYQEIEKLLLEKEKLLRSINENHRKIAKQFREKAKELREMAEKLECVYKELNITPTKTEHASQVDKLLNLKRILSQREKELAERQERILSRRIKLAEKTRELNIKKMSKVSDKAFSSCQEKESETSSTNSGIEISISEISQFLSKEEYTAKSLTK